MECQGVQAHPRHRDTSIVGSDQRGAGVPDRIRRRTATAARWREGLHRLDGEGVLCVASGVLPSVPARPRQPIAAATWRSSDDPARRQGVPNRPVRRADPRDPGRDGRRRPVAAGRPTVDRTINNHFHVEQYSRTARAGLEVTEIERRERAAARCRRRLAPGRSPTARRSGSRAIPDDPSAPTSPPARRSGRRLHDQFMSTACRVTSLIRTERYTGTDVGSSRRPSNPVDDNEITVFDIDDNVLLAAGLTHCSGLRGRSTV